MVAESRTKGKGRTNGMLARRKAALGRAAERVAEQRRTAAEAEAGRLRREAAFDELAADFELAVEDEQAVAAAVEEEVRLVRERGQVRINEARVAAARVVLAMGEAGETVAGCGRRLGVGTDRVKELRRLGREGPTEEVAQPVTEPEGKPVAERERAGSRGKTKVVKESPGGERPGGVREAVPAGAGSAPVAASAVTAPVASPGLSVPADAPAAASAGPVSGVRPGWPESR